MWTSIKNIYLPESFEEAIKLKQDDFTVYFAGGSHLVSAKNKSITTLIDINKLINKAIQSTDNSIIIGSGATVQEIVNNSDDLLKLSEAAKFSNFSKNIRNQRTIGGEIAQRNVRSDLFTFLLALNPILVIGNPEETEVRMREWNGHGIIDKIIINKTDLRSSGFERFSLLDSAPAFLMVAVVRKALEIDFVISGKAKKIYGHTMKLAEFSKNSVRSMIDKSSNYFENDQYGSIDYKASLIATGIQRAVEQI